MKINLRPKGELFATGADVFKIRSTSDPLSWHFVAVEYDYNSKGFERTIVTCSCKGFMTHKKCWHVDAVNNGDWDEQ